MDNRREERRLIQDSFWRERIFGVRELSDEKILRRMEFLDLYLAGPYYCVVLFAPYLMEKDAEKIDTILMKILKSVREDYSRAGIQCYTISDNYCNVVGILSLESEEVYRKLNTLTLKVTNDLIRRNDVNMFVGIGEMVDRLSQLSKSKDTASEALAHKFTFSNNYVITSKDVKRYYNRGDVELKVHFDWIMGCFFDGNLTLMSVRLQNMFAVVRESAANELDSIHNVCIELTATLNRTVREMGVESTPEMEGVYTQIVRIDSVPEISEWFLHYCAELLRRVGDLRKDKTQQILDMAEEYIERNIGDPNLTIQTISDYVELSAPYFSSIFFKAKGLHLNEFINRLRVKHAQRMLLESTEKINDIARKLGFSSPSYFNSVFKRYTGVAPGYYRDRG